MNRSLRQTCAVSALGALAAGCASAPERSVSVPPNAGVYKVGKPYQIGDTWYYPREQPDYDETGIASWYGPGFYGHNTADGEMLDPDALTAAHRTLPLGTHVRVTNEKNGRAVEVRINDRGPFGRRDRIIDLSKAAARELHMLDAGVVPVTVEVLR